MDASKAAELVAPGTLLGGKYRVLRTLGEGGMGTVLLARHEDLRQQFAIKLLLGPESLDAERVERFLREARAAATLQSPHVVRVIDVGRFDQIAPYIVMEYLQGTDLDQLLLERGPLPVEQAVDFVLEAIDAVAEAHAHGIVHRDLKPSNLFLATRTDRTSIVKVLDFGISKQIASDARERKLTGAKLPLGTPVFMSPEQLKNASDVDARADIWSLGVVLYELVTGALPFAGDSSHELLANVLTEPPRTLREHRPDAPEGLERVIRRCLERRREDRFRDVGELAVALTPFGSVQRPSLAPRIASMLQRRPSALEVTAPRAERPGRDRETQRSWGLVSASGATTRQLVLAVAGGLGAAMLIGMTAVLLLRGPGSDGAAASPTDSAQAPAVPVATALADSTAEDAAASAISATPTPSPSPSTSAPRPPPPHGPTRAPPRPSHTPPATLYP